MKLIDIDTSAIDPLITDIPAMVAAIKAEFPGATVVAAPGPVIRGLIGFGADTRVVRARLRIALIDHMENIR